MASALLQPIREMQGSEKLTQTWERLQELFTGRAVPEPFAFYAHCSVFLQDFYMNFKKYCWNDGKLDSRSKAVVCYAVSASAGCALWAKVFEQRLQELGGPPPADILAVTATCSMYNTFFKFRDLSGSDLFQGLPVGLRAHTFAGTALDEKCVELVNVVISDINGCKPCTSGHVAKARELGWSDDAILEAIQAASTLQGGIVFLRMCAGNSTGEPCRTV
ncbi:MAG: hypothetical protein KatS3mg114_1174 [Planctomycetaceae bacterium]|nr:MAG: hypothetical protein KatS3mg114_1174 [Planctomycetaceae bacterium]